MARRVLAAIALMGAARIALADTKLGGSTLFLAKGLHSKVPSGEELKNFDGTRKLQEPPKCDHDRMCCKAMTADCLACDACLTVEELCAAKPDVVGCEAGQQVERRRDDDKCDHDRMCCMAMTADCLACKACQTVEELCIAKPEVVGCESYTRHASAGCENDRVCCQGLTAECVACKKCQTVEEFCSAEPDFVGCESAKELAETPRASKECEHDRVCCLALTAECVACTKCQTVEEFCSAEPNFVGCEPAKELDETPHASQQREEFSMCCRAYTAECMACARHQTVEEFCSVEPNFVGCEPVKETSTLGQPGSERR